MFEILLNQIPQVKTISLQGQTFSTILFYNGGGGPPRSNNEGRKAFCSSFVMVTS